MKNLILIITFLYTCSFAQEEIPDYKNTNLTFEERAKDLVSHLTLEEKIAQMSSWAPEVKRLGVPAFSYQGEALHGLAEAGHGKLMQATSFPTSITMGSTWNPDLMEEVATAISDEARAAYNMGEMDISFWSPTINMLRDPRWGRNDEAYSEDPHLMSKMAVAFVKGLQGTHPEYLKTIASPKHFVANNSEFNRHDGNSEVTERWLREYYFPAYKACFQEGGAFATMCAYNRLNGVPACCNEWLLTTVLRDEWGFDGYVVTDCGAIMDIFANHNYVETPEEASALAVKAGCDLNCGNIYVEALGKAVEKGLVTEKDFDAALEKMFVGRLKLGLFAPADEFPYSDFPPEIIESKKHQNLALRAAQESLILLKNENFLPLSKDLKSIAVIGPNANRCVLGAYSGDPSRKISVYQGIKEKLGESVEVYHEKGCNITTPDKINFDPEAWDEDLQKKETYALDFEELELKRMFDLYTYETKETDEVLIERAVNLAKKVEKVVLVLGANRFTSTEEDDAENLLWPGNQEKLLRAVHEVNPNIVLVMIKGYQVTINWEKENIPAILEAFTKGRTYWFFDKEVLYPFGYGLSYTTFEYQNLKVDKKNISVNDKNKIEVSVDIVNTGKLKGDEIVQVYIKDLESSVIQPQKRLRDFKRISLEPQELKSVPFELSKDDFLYWNEKKGDWDIELGDFEIQIGASSEDIRLYKTISAK
jgi:beta-glucosidase